MIRICGVRLSSSMDENAIKAAIPAQWLEAWRAAHPRLCRPSAMLQSLAGLWLLQRSGAEGALSYTALGKPLLSGTQIGITHTAEQVFCAVSDGESPVGIDAEEVNGRLDGDRRQAMAKRWFSDAEQALAMASEREFYRVWTRKEAYVKMTGEGLCGVRAVDTEAASCSFSSFFEGDAVVTVAHARSEEVEQKIEMLNPSKGT